MGSASGGSGLPGGDQNRGRVRIQGSGFGRKRTGKTKEMNPGQITGTEDLPGDFCVVFAGAYRIEDGDSYRIEEGDFIYAEGMVK